MNRADVRLSKFLSLVLRHRPEAAGLSLDREGWADLDLLVSAARQRRLARETEDVLRVVAENDKKRFSLSVDARRIRAVQGHSAADVDLTLVPVVPPERLFHGTAEANLPSILAEGLKPGRRHYVHLSPDAVTARLVGSRHGKPVVLAVDAAGLHNAGHAIYRAENGVWLTPHVPAAFIQRVTDSG
jgi:putative RNA 2'-phosphotransferase